MTPEPQAPPININSNGRGHLHLAQSIRSLRLRNGMSQRQLALRMSVPRTYVSKIENEKATPTLSSLERLARALEVSVPSLLTGGERSRQEEVRELMEDQFVAEVYPYLSQLNGMQMSSILAQVRDLDRAAAPQRVNRFRSIFIRAHTNWTAGAHKAPAFFLERVSKIPFQVWRRIPQG